jgi:hypothetical protein
MYEISRVPEGSVIEVPTIEAIENQIRAAFDHINIGADKVERLERAKSALAHAGQNWGNSAHMALEYLTKLEAARLEVATAAAKLEAARGEAAALQQKINHAKTVILDATKEDSGCQDGKRQFLKDTGLFDDDEIRAAFDEEIDVQVLITVEAFTIYVPAGKAWRSEVEAGEADVDDQVDQSDVDDAIRDYIRHNNVDWYTEEVSEI